MIDPSDAMNSFQKEILNGKILLTPGVLNPSIFLYGDRLNNGATRLTYITLENTTITSFVNFVSCSPIKGTPCFQIGYAVPKFYQNKGLAKRIIFMALTEMKYGLQMAGILEFYIEAIVEEDNKASQRVAEKVISTNPERIIDDFNGLPAFYYLRLIK